MIGGLNVFAGSSFTWSLSFHFTARGGRMELGVYPDPLCPLNTTQSFFN